MSYTKNIAVIKQLKDGFSSDGGKLSGLVKVEKYGQKLKAEVTLINFAPISEGRIICAISDGNSVQIVENGVFEGESGVNTDGGFASLICYINGGVFPIASAICGNYGYAALGIKEQVEKLENFKSSPPSDGQQKYEDEAIAEDNYYEYENNESEDTVRPNNEEENCGQESGQNEEAFSSVEAGENGVNNSLPPIYAADNENSLPPEYAKDNAKKNKLPPIYAANNGLAGGNFYDKVKGEIESVFGKYPKVTDLEKLIEGSRWAKIDYGENKFYVFGVLYSEGNAEYICYGVPATDNSVPPESMRELASFIPSSEENTNSGYWVMYQDARTGASIKIKNI